MKNDNLMEKRKVLFSINNETQWNKVTGNADDLLNYSGEIEKVAIVAMGTAILSLLKNSIIEDLKAKIREITSKGVDIYLCVNTMTKYGITASMLLPEIRIAEKGANLKILELTG